MQINIKHLQFFFLRKFKLFQPNSQLAAHNCIYPPSIYEKFIKLSKTIKAVTPTTTIITSHLKWVPL